VHEPATGAPAGSNPVSETLTTSVTVSIGGVSVPAAFSGLAPGFIGPYQVNVQIPASAAAGPAVPLTIAIRGKASNQGSIAVAVGS
jgi:uncharacterized protein (TIGR03437 family)